MLLNTIVNLSVVGGILNPVVPPPGQQPLPAPPVDSDPGSTGNNPDRGAVDGPNPQDPGQHGHEPGIAPPWRSGTGPSHEAGNAYRPGIADMEIQAVDENWARRAALALQEDERVSRMIEDMATPKATEVLSLLRNDDAPRSDLKSVIAAYRENELSEEEQNVAA